MQILYLKKLQIQSLSNKERNSISWKETSQEKKKHFSYHKTMNNYSSFHPVCPTCQLKCALNPERSWLVDQLIRIQTEEGKSFHFSAHNQKWGYIFWRRQIGLCVKKSLHFPTLISGTTAAMKLFSVWLVSNENLHNNEYSCSQHWSNTSTQEFI